jgi:hypothetical protein
VPQERSDGERVRTDLLARVGKLMEPFMHAHVEEFYDTLGGRTGPAEVLSRLSARELEDLKDSDVRGSAHAEVHHTALQTRGSRAHRAAWERLVTLMDEG